MTVFPKTGTRWIARRRAVVNAAEFRSGGKAAHFDVDRQGQLANQGVGAGKAGRFRIRVRGQFRPLHHRQRELVSQRIDQVAAGADRIVFKGEAAKTISLGR